MEIQISKKDLYLILVAMRHVESMGLRDPGHYGGRWGWLTTRTLSRIEPVCFCYLRNKLSDVSCEDWVSAANALTNTEEEPNGNSD